MANYSESHLASAVIWWLNYISATGREYIIAERTIAIPATDYLEKYFPDEIILEYDHPSLSQKKIDLYFNDSKNKAESTFEFKFVRQDSTSPLKERKRIFNDLMRLNLAAVNGVKGYFLICGNQFHFNACFQNFKLQGLYPALSPRVIPSGTAKSGYFGEWFSFDLLFPTRDIKLKSRDKDYSVIYKAFHDDYKGSFHDATNTKLKMPSSISTKLLFLSEDLASSNIPQTFKIGIWQIL